jgi:hypothetical protein
LSGVFGVFRAPLQHITLRNKTTVNQSSTFTATNSNVKNFLSDGGYNETTSNLLSLSTTSNLIEVWVNGSILKLILILEWNPIVVYT